MAKHQRNYTFNSEWEDQYCFIEYKGKSMCLLCNGSISIAKKSNVERHFLPLIKNRSCLSDLHLDDALRAACSSYIPEFPQLAVNIACQISH
jgi:hypothetical protein